MAECDFTGVADLRAHFEGEVGRYLTCKKSDGSRRRGARVSKRIFSQTVPLIFAALLLDQLDLLRVDHVVIVSSRETREVDIQTS